MQLFLNIPRVAQAFQAAVVAHQGQKYGNLPYFTHVLTVAENVPDPTEDELVAALLHDIVEDTPWQLMHVAEQFGDNVAEIVGLVTKDPDLSYEGNIMRIIASGNQSAIKIKWADNLANMRSNKSDMSAERRDKLNEKYAKSFPALSSVLGV